MAFSIAEFQTPTTNNKDYIAFYVSFQLKPKKKKKNYIIYIVYGIVWSGCIDLFTYKQTPVSSYHAGSIL